MRTLTSYCCHLECVSAYPISLYFGCLRELFARQIDSLKKKRRGLLAHCLSVGLLTRSLEMRC